MDRRGDPPSTATGSAIKPRGLRPLLVLLHGIAGTSATWDDVLPLLEPATRSSPRTSSAMGNPPSLRATTRSAPTPTSVRDLLEALGYERATIAGHSLGGGIALQFAYQFYEKCERLVLVLSGGLGREVHPLLRAAALPGAEVVLPWLSKAGRQHRQGRPRAGESFGLRASADLEESWRGFISLEDSEARRAFLQAHGAGDRRPRRSAGQRPRSALPCCRAPNAYRLGREGPAHPGAARSRGPRADPRQPSRDPSRCRPLPPPGRSAPVCRGPSRFHEDHDTAPLRQEAPAGAASRGGSVGPGAPERLASVRLPPRVAFSAQRETLP